MKFNATLGTDVMKVHNSIKSQQMHDLIKSKDVTYPETCWQNPNASA